MKLYLVRHGETDENLRAIVMGWLDVPLNATGKEQALRQAAAFTHEVDAIFCSDLRRCVETAEPFRVALPHLPFLLDWRLRERYLGEAQGRPRDAVFRDGSSEVAVPDAEPLEQHRVRVQSFFDSLRQLESRFPRVLVVAHNGTINRMVELLNHTEDSTHTDYANGSCVELEL